MPKGALCLYSKLVILLAFWRGSINFIQKMLTRSILYRRK